VIEMPRKPAVRRRRRPAKKITVAGQTFTTALSPYGLGRHARDEKGPGVVGIGRDGTLWETRRRVNGSLYWARLTENIVAPGIMEYRPRARKPKPRARKLTKPSAIDAPCRFTGKEPSPKGLGHCAHNQRGSGVVKRGRDGRMWETRRRVNGSLYWARRARK